MGAGARYGFDSICLAHVLGAVVSTHMASPITFVPALGRAQQHQHAAGEEGRVSASKHAQEMDAEEGARCKADACAWCTHQALWSAHIWPLLGYFCES